ncbi:unnamed protein product [marine sediment metagenome]|uniref:Uncharacterized protein n=1 Tax=marine sediment metagenome TaxID=412755 RepID=X1HHT4_9ZZZZ
MRSPRGANINETVENEAIEFYCLDKNTSFHDKLTIIPKSGVISPSITLDGLNL